MPAIATDPDAVHASDLAKPGGFRRDFLKNQADQLELHHGKVVFRDPSWERPLLSPPQQRGWERKSIAWKFGLKMTTLFTLMEDDEDEDEDEEHDCS